MTSIRKLFFLVLAVALTAFALPAAAADKVFQLLANTYNSSSVSLGNTIPSGANVWLLLDFENQTPTTYNSVFKSIRVTVPPDVTYSVAKVQTVNTGTCSTTMPSTMPTPGTAVSGLPAGTGGQFTINNLTGVKPSGDLCVYVAVKTNLTSCTSVQWGGEANTGSQFGGGTPFTDVNTTSTISYATTSDGCTGVLGCTSTGSNTGGGLSLNESGYEGAVNWGIVRGNNWNGETCTFVGYQFNISTKNASFISGAKGAQDISAEYVVLFNPLPYPYVNSNQGAWPNLQPKVAWSDAYEGGSANFGSSGTTTPAADDYVPALACLDDDVNGPNATVLPAIPNDGPGGPYFTAAAAGGGNPQYAFGKLAMMCVANHGWTSMYFPDNLNQFGLNAGAYLQPWYKIIDRSDGFTKSP